ncbi:MAG TPA: transcriptional repressor [Solirubrobacteraceae bacterium]|nr:transcriptional repressor [Solirubrobacteraceae bacterium]
MTVSPDAPPLAFEDLDDAVRALRESGLRLSTPRRLVLEALFDAEGPVSAVHLSRQLSVDESSVYRNLEVLEQHGLVRHVHLGHSPGLYTLVGTDEVEYLYCERCAKVTAVNPDRLDEVRQRIKREFGYTARFTHFAIVGVCEECATGRDGPAGRSGGAHQLHSHGDRVHSHPHDHAGGGHTH